ncbi:major histocompatibility complex class I-related gene protein-like [Erythrolamprus reginae]|uniref:major histocompatibility complex class I-related gene protein-like n=1 Tax=Erythrolamprus reginae TaxID=121349 RepID=UPI00396CD281
MNSSQDRAQYIAVVYVDDQLAARFDTTTRRMLPQVAWLHNVKEEDSHFWNTTSQIVNSMELKFRNDLHFLHNNSIRGFHSWQNVLGCKLSDKGQKQGICQYGYDGEDFISLDQKTVSWITHSVPAQKIKRRLKNMTLLAHRMNHCLENDCIELLRKCVTYGKDSLLRKEPPVAELTCRIQKLVTLVCRVYGFYPKEVNVTWRKDGEVWKKNISWAGIFPNSNGTYHTWLSIEIDPEEKRDHYRCYVEHAGLPEPLIVAWVESASILGILTAVMVPVVALTGVVIFYIAKCVGDKGRKISTTSHEFQMQPVLQGQDQRQQGQDQKQKTDDNGGLLKNANEGWATRTFL